MTETTVAVHEDREALATAVAGALLERLAARQQGDVVPHLGLTGGSVADRVHHRVADLAPGSGVDWSRVVWWWSDERYVAADSADRNAAPARRAMLDRLPVVPEHVHEMPAADAGRPLDEAAAAYDRALRTDGGGEFEVLLLGVGEDGHVASLFPGHPALGVRDQITVGVPDSPKPPPERITLTLEALNRSRAVWFVASGAGKAEAVARARAGAPVDEVPASGVTGRVETRWFLDADAAAALPRD